MQEKRVLIIGVAGFVGRYAVQEFARHHYYVFGSDTRDSVDLPGLDSYKKADLTDEESMLCLMREARPTHIVNLAAISSVGFSWKEPAKTFEVNVIGPLNLFSACIKANIHARILLIGSSEEYSPSSRPINEQWPIFANNPYGISKATQEQIGKLFSSGFGLEIFYVRAFNHIGVGQTASFVISNWCKQVAEIEKTGSPGVIKVGNTGVVRDISDVRDVVKAYRRIIEEAKNGEVFNVGSGVGRRLSDVLKTILSFSNQNIQIEVDPTLLRPNDNPCIICDPSKIKEQLGWEPSISFQETLLEIYKDYLNRG